MCGMNRFRKTIRNAFTKQERPDGLRSEPQILHWQHTGTQQLDWEQQGLQQLDWEQQGLQQLDWETERLAAG
ncbi:hypothetical protein AAY473_002366 [Plecturocebus cupreus]